MNYICFQRDIPVSLRKLGWTCVRKLYLKPLKDFFVFSFLLFLPYNQRRFFSTLPIWKRRDGEQYPVPLYQHNNYLSLYQDRLFHTPSAIENHSLSWIESEAVNMLERLIIWACALSLSYSLNGKFENRLTWILQSLCSPFSLKWRMTSIVKFSIESCQLCIRVPSRNFWLCSFQCRYALQNFQLVSLFKKFLVSNLVSLFKVRFTVQNLFQTRSKMLVRYQNLWK